ncbi:hypothetical protein U713_07575 [Rhodobacter capsulatus YW2]|nr:hypothetical protein U713_07575 [Rhodobacter capsulatus YW2]
MRRCWRVPERCASDVRAAASDALRQRRFRALFHAAEGARFARATVA